MSADLFGKDSHPRPIRIRIADGAVILTGRALHKVNDLQSDLAAIVQEVPFRHMVTPGGFTMSVSMTNCGLVGWVSDQTGYRYDMIDPVHGMQWPQMPSSFRELASAAAAEVGYQFEPDSCLVNHYLPKSRLSLHQDRNETDFSKPIVSISLGLSATFPFGGMSRAEVVLKYPLHHGDIVVSGGPSRLRFHGVAPLKKGDHVMMGPRRINLTFRKAL